MFERFTMRMLLPGLALVIAPLIHAQEEAAVPTRLAQNTTVRPAPVPRNTAAPRPALPATGAGVTPAQGNGANGELPEMVDLDFKDTPLIQVIEQLSAWTDLTFDVDPNIAQSPVTIINRASVPREQVLPILESILFTRGLALVEDVDGYLIKIMPSTDPKRPVKDKFFIGELGDNIPGDYDGTSTHLVSVLYADPQILADTLNKLGGGPEVATVDVYLPTNMLIINGTSDALRSFDKFLQLTDVPGLGTETELFFLEYTSAEVLAQQLTDVLLDTGEGEGAPATVRRTTVTPVRTTTTRPTAIRAASSTPQVFGSREETLRVLSDERLNAIIAVASEGMMEQVRGLVKQLDSPVSIERQNLHIYELLNADAEKVQEALQDIVSGSSSRRSAGAAPGAAGGGGAAASVAGNAQAFDGEVSVTQYEQTNSLLIVASPQDYRVLESFIERLDVPQRQVYVDAVVMDVTLTDEYTVTVDAAGLTGNDGFGLTSTGNIASLLSVANTATDIASGASGIATSLLTLGGSGGLTTGIFDNITLNIAGQETTVPFVPLLFQALETVTDIEILSQPSLSTVDNEEASIAVGQEVPFITSTGSPRSVGTDGGLQDNAYGGYTRVQREEVGVKMKVTPQITEGDNVLLEIEIEVSKVSANQVGSVDIVGPTTDKSIITNKVLVKDGSTAVLAGLISNTVDRSKSQTPILGDIPGLGFLFRNKNSTMRKRNMVILVTPHIVKESVDSERVTDYKVEEYHQTNLEGLMRTGFIKKSVGKFQDRKNYRPTYERAEELTGKRSGARFGRGDIKR